MSIRKDTAGARLEILLKARSSMIVGKFDKDIELPWAMACCPLTIVLVVRDESRSKIGGQSRVVARWLFSVLQNVHKSPSSGHVTTQMQGGRLPRIKHFLNDRRYGARPIAEFAMARRESTGRTCHP